MKGEWLTRLCECEECNKYLEKQEIGYIKEGRKSEIIDKQNLRKSEERKLLSSVLPSENSSSSQIESLSEIEKRLINDNKIPMELKLLYAQRMEGKKKKLFFYF